MIPCPGKPDPAEDLVLMKLPAEAAVFYRKMVEDAAAEMEAAVKELGIPVAPPPPAGPSVRCAETTQPCDIVKIYIETFR